MVMSSHTLGSSSVLVFDGILDDTTYLPLRDCVIESALTEPRAVIVDVTDLQVPVHTAWSVFTSARWHVSLWPDIPVSLVCQDGRRRQEIVRAGLTRRIPVYPTVESACSVFEGEGTKPLSRADVRLPAVHSSLHRARELVIEWLLTWWHPDLIPVASIVVDVLVENVLEHTQSSPHLVAESRGDTVAIAVEDRSKAPALRHEDAYHGAIAVSGLAVVAAVTRAWGSIPTTTGKTVWALIGPENRL
ncbi:STAS domain-containing protein [Mycobacterium sp. LTG2003]